ncbi:hypothetical protein HPT27_16000 [Permianibacter sp. IMCC34836]|uniref:hypothetical protein n=1 Tax=Permianibacter fluminis TaxID=2738515 RepID=UPI0015569819|nr:hypothetical protein [Permianibacter fluminis]NQD38526.1 hypothetical protein [Permianibacter fluminis]
MTLRFIAAASAVVLAVPVMAAEPDTDARIAALQQQIDELRNAQQAPSTPSSANAFNPAISLILMGTYSDSSIDPDAFALPGFMVTEEGAPASQGFSLGESEMTLSASVDDQWYAQTTVAFEEADGSSEVSVEEAYIESTALPDGFTLKMGRFLSDIGYLNHHHSHTDNFLDRPFVYRSFIDHGYGDNGVQLRYLLPTDFYVELGGEYLRGDGYPAQGASHDGRGAYTLFAHVGGDVGVSSSWLAGLSQLNASTEAGDDGFTGDLKLTIADLTWKWAPNGNRKQGELVARTEWFAEDRDGSWQAIDGNASSDWNSRRRGGYAEATYKWPSGWLAGLRVDRVTGDAGAPAPFASGDSSDGYSLVLGLQHTEFSLLRGQLSVFDGPDGDREHSVALQYVVAIGAHGAHKF